MCVLITCTTGWTKEKRWVKRSGREGSRAGRVECGNMAKKRGIFPFIVLCVCVSTSGLYSPTSFCMHKICAFIFQLGTSNASNSQALFLSFLLHSPHRDTIVMKIYLALASNVACIKTHSVNDCSSFLFCYSIYIYTLRCIVYIRVYKYMRFFSLLKWEEWEYREYIIYLAVVVSQQHRYK